MVNNMNKQNIKKYLAFIFILLLIGVISGIIYYYNLDSNIKENVINTLAEYKIVNINNIFKHFLILAIILVLSIFVVGVPLAIFYLYFEGVTIGFTITIFTIKFGISGLLYGIIYNLATKLFFLFLLVIFLNKIFNITKIIISKIAYRNYHGFKTNIVLKFKSSLIILIIIFINDLIIYLTSGKFLSIFNYLLK